MKSASIRALAASLALSAAWAPALFSPLTAQDSNTVMEPEFEAENDPFIWLEETRSERALEWVEAENQKWLPKRCSARSPSARSWTE